MTPSLGITSDLAFIVVAGLLGGIAAKLCRQPLLVGYIIAGIFLGPYTGGITISDPHQIELLAEIGVALLLFAIGAEFSFRELKPVALISLVGAPIQIILTALFGFYLGQTFGFSYTESVWFGGMISFSSTMVVLKTLSSQGLMGTLSSKVMLGILLVQDLAVVPLLILLPQISQEAVDLQHLFFALAKAAGFILAIAFLGFRMNPRVMRQIVLWDSRELFLISVTAIALGIGYITYLFGLSFALGAFVAGIVISESEYSHQALSEVIPLRDIFGLLFFVSVGMLLDPSYVMNNAGLILSAIALVSCFKGVLFFVLAVLFKYKNVLPLALGLGMFQIGEFSFVMGRVGVTEGFISKEVFSLILSTAIATMIVTPLSASLVRPLYERIRKKKSEGVETSNVLEENLKKHVVIVGGGRVGRYVAEVLKRLQISFVIAELNFRNVELCKEKGYPVIFGDGAQEHVLLVAGLAEAELLLITVPNEITALQIVSIARAHNSLLRIVARASGVEQMNLLYEKGVYEVVQPEFEAALEIMRQALLRMDVSLEEILGISDSLRKELYAPVLAEEKS